jgi:beta-xylosidase
MQLRVAGSRSTYAFSYAQGTQGFKPLGAADTYLLSTETAGDNTGVFLGLYATAAGAQAAPAALFD